MTLDLWVGEVYLGSVMLAREPLACGWLRPTRAYAPAVAPLLLRASARLASDAIEVPPEIDAAIDAALHGLYARLRLTDVHGVGVPAERIELWDSNALEEPPFVLVDFQQKPSPPPPRTERSHAGFIGASGRRR